MVAILKRMRTIGLGHGKKNIVSLWMTDQWITYITYCLIEVKCVCSGVVLVRFKSLSQTLTIISSQRDNACVGSQLERLQCVVPCSLCFGTMVTYPDHKQSCSSLYQDAKRMERSELKTRIHLQGHFSVSFLLLCSKIPDQKQLRRQRGLFHLTIPGFRPSYQRSQGRNGKHLDTSGSQSRAEKEQMSVCQLAWASFSFSSHRVQDTCLGNDATHSRLGFPTSNTLTETIPGRHPHRPTQWGIVYIVLAVGVSVGDCLQEFGLWGGLWGDCLHQFGCRCVYKGLSTLGWPVGCLWGEVIYT